MLHLRSLLRKIPVVEGVGDNPLRLLFRVPPISTYIRTFLGQSLRAAYMTQHINRIRVELTVQASITPGKSYMMCSLTSISDIWKR